MLRRSDLRRFQTFFIRKILQCFHIDPGQRLPGVMLALEPGAGKTATVLFALLDLLNRFLIRRALIVAPLLAAQTVWPLEMEEWEELGALTWTLIRVEDDDEDVAAAGQAAYDEALARFQAEFEAERESEVLMGLSKAEARARARALQGKSPGRLAEPFRLQAMAEAKDAKLRRLIAEDTDIHIINREALDWLWDVLPKKNKADWPYDILVIDDCREARGGKHRRKKDKDKHGAKPAPLTRWGIMARMRKYVMATIQLTGTPTPKGLQNMWGLIYPIDLGARLGTGKTAFMQRWFNIDRDRHKVTPHEHSFGEIMGRVKDIMFSLDPRDMPDLPPFIVDPIRVRLPDAVMAEYKRFKRKSVSEEYDVEAVNGGVLHGKLLQFANGSMYHESGDDVWVHDVKIEALRDLVARLDGKPLLVAVTYQFDIDRIMKAFPDAVLLRPQNALRTVKAWNRDEIPLLIAHRASAGHALNLQKGTGHMCEYGLTSDAELYLQFLKRLLRPGRRAPVFNHVIIAEGTIDDDVFPMYLDPKIAEQIRIMTEVQVSFQNELTVDDVDDLLA